jgi:hypothetical protein
VHTPWDSEIPFEWYTPFSSENYTYSDVLWENVRPSHGLVAVDSAFAEKEGLPNSTVLPHRESMRPKKVYLLQSYHHIHCLVSTRTAQCCNVELIEFRESSA